MRIGIIGQGHVGGALGKGWANVGHEVVFGARDPKSPKVAELLAGIGGNARAGTVTEAADAGEVVVLATPWSAAEGIVKTLGDLGGKPLFDVVNPVLPNFSGLAHGPDTSAAEMIAGWAEGAKVVKIFNTTGANNMANPAYPDGAATMFYCGDDASAKQIAHQLAADLGFDP